MSQLDRLNTLPLHQLWPYAQPLVSNLSLLLNEGSPRQVSEHANVHNQSPVANLRALLIRDVFFVFLDNCK